MGMPRNHDVPQDQKCFACDRKFGDRRHDFPEAITIDGQRVFVGNDCMRKIQKAGHEGYQPPTGGPRLYCDLYAPEAALKAAGITIIWGAAKPAVPEGA